MVGESRAFKNSWSKWARTYPTRAKKARTTELNGSGEGEEKGDKEVRDFGPGW